MKKVIALDIGGTNTRVALINENYEVEKVLINPTVVGNLDLFLQNVSKTVREAIDDFSGVVAIAARSAFRKDRKRSCCGGSACSGCTGDCSQCNRM